MNSKKYYFITYGFDKKPDLDSVVSDIHPLEWLKNQNTKIIEDRNADIEETREYIKQKQTERKAKYKKMNFLQKFFSNLGRKLFSGPDLLHGSMMLTRIEELYHPIKIINWKEISESEYREFNKQIVNN